MQWKFIVVIVTRIICLWICKKIDSEMNIYIPIHNSMQYIPIHNTHSIIHFARPCWSGRIKMRFREMCRKRTQAHLVLLVSFESSVQVFERDVVVLVQPLHHERLEPTAIGAENCKYITIVKKKLIHSIICNTLQ